MRAKHGEETDNDVNGRNERKMLCASSGSCDITENSVIRTTREEKPRCSNEPLSPAAFSLATGAAAVTHGNCGTEGGVRKSGRSTEPPLQNTGLKVPNPSGYSPVTSEEHT
ncbi:uncharacterized protein ACWYII_022309 isoform 1-T1 [Salvelinus alpinus]